MVITLDSALPCAHYQATPSMARHPLCGQPTTRGIISPADGNVWELLPVCHRHLAEMNEWERTDQQHPACSHTAHGP